jgi:hypothetical protein
MKKKFLTATLAFVIFSCGDSKQAEDEKKVSGDSLTNMANDVAAAADSIINADADTIKAGMQTVDTTKK